MDTFDICQNEMQFRIHYFSLALVIPHPVLSRHLCLWLSAESAALVFQWEQLTAACGAAVSRASSGASPGPAGSWFSCAPPWGPGGLCCHLLALQWPGGDNISEAAFAPWVTAAGTPGFTLPNKASRASKLRDDISHFLFSPHKVINERISAVNSLGWFIIYFYFFFTIHLSITWNCHWNQQDLQYLFFLLGNTVYSDHPILLLLPRDLAEWMLMK